MKKTENRGWLAGVATRLVGDHEVLVLEHRVLNAITFLACLVTIVSTGANIVLGNPIVMTVLTLITLVITAVLYLFSRNARRWQPLTAPAIIAFLLIVAVTWLTQAGTLGGGGYYFFLVVIAAIVLNRRALVLIAATVVGLLFVEMFWSSLIVPYPLPKQRFPDVAVSWAMCLTISAVMVYVIYGEYHRERKHVAVLLKQVTAEKEHALDTTREKQQLLSMVSNDIANALAVADYSAALIKRKNRNGEPLDTALLDQLQFATGNISEIIHSVRLMEAVKQGRVALSLDPVRLKDVIGKSLRLFSEQLASHHIALSLPSDAQQAIEVLAEPRMLTNHVLNHLLSNAIKFSRAGAAVTIDIYERDNMVGISVKDTGIGIPEEMLPHLFNPLVKTSRPGLNGEPGTGFGLMTVKNFVELFGGDIEVHSIAESSDSEEHGTVITVYLKKSESVGEG
ncbi:MAG: HAMP domain-containing histidine kinase [Deltaproteobacteria bacterium]|nr:HAMP domain-containing histidine kinase [Deltaproteobacteria bacterium]